MTVGRCRTCGLPVGKDDPDHEANCDPQATKDEWYRTSMIEHTEDELEAWDEYQEIRDWELEPPLSTQLDLGLRSEPTVEPQGDIDA